MTVWYVPNSIINFRTISKFSFNHFYRFFFQLWSIILCGEHSSSYFWTSEDTRYLSTTCVKAWCSIYSCTSLSDILLGRSPKASSPSFKSILLQLRPKLLHETWRRYPGAVSAYKWIVCQVHSPNLSEYVGIISPTSLLILDDHIRERRLIGLQCLSHIIDNVVSKAC